MNVTVNWFLLNQLIDVRFFSCTVVGTPYKLCDNLSQVMFVKIVTAKSWISVRNVKRKNRIKMKLVLYNNENRLFLLPPI